VRRFFEQIWEEKGHLAWILSPLSLLYLVGWRTYLLIYELGLKKAYQPTIPTLCIGNCTAGGSGKTPFTLHVAEQLTQRGIAVVLSTSGYHSPKYQRATLAPDGPLDPAIWSDEAAMFRDLLPTVHLIVGHDRVAAAQIAEQHFPQSALLMDDGFQHLRLKPQLSLIIEPELENDFCFPAGPYREPRTLGAKRATRVLTYDRDLQPLPIQLRTSSGEQAIQKGQANALCAIAHPYRFFNSLETIGITLAAKITLPDHDDLTDLSALKKLNPELPLIVTAKDFVKLKYKNVPLPQTVLVANYQVAPREPEAFFDWLISQINEIRRDKEVH
jgi:tetraacyldisaccharide 4'-kinase